MIVHCLKCELPELKTALDKHKISYTIRHERDSKIYIDYNVPILGKYTYNKNWVNNHVAVVIKNYTKFPEELQTLMSKINKLYMYFKSYKRPSHEYKIPTIKERPKYPIYVISYKRYESMITMKYLEMMKCDYFIVIKQFERDLYKNSLDAKKYKHYTLLCMDEKFEKKQIEMGNGGGIPQRNYCLKHSTMNGHKSHWIVDDNIKGFYYYNYGTRTPMNHYSFFTLMELFRDNIKEDVGLLSPNYKGYMRKYRAPYYQNTKNYSCILVNNELLNKHGIKWRKKYNEDVRLSIECMINRLITIEMNMFLIDKISTGRIKGGNCDIYKYRRKEIKMDKKFIDDKIRFENDILKHIENNNFTYSLEYINSKYKDSKYKIHYGLFLKFIEIYCEYPMYIKLYRSHVDKRPHHKIIFKLFDDTLPKITFHKT